MKKVLFVLGLIVGSLSVTQAQQAHVVLITVDGFRPDFYKDASWYSRLLPGFHGNRNRFRCFWKRYSEKYGRTPNGTGRHRPLIAHLLKINLPSADGVLYPGLLDKVQ